MTMRGENVLGSLPEGTLNLIYEKLIKITDYAHKLPKNLQTGLSPCLSYATIIPCRTE